MVIRRLGAALKPTKPRFIIDVVTGKLDVNEAAARLPDEAKVPEELMNLDSTP